MVAGDQAELGLADVSYHYVHIALGFFGQAYVVLFVSLYYAIHTELSVGEQELLTYSSLVSLVVLFFSRHTQWTAPVLIEDALIVAVVWILLGNLLHAATDCICCPEAQACFWQNNHALFSVLCVALMFVSFLFQAANLAAAIFFRLTTVALLLVVPIVPVSCNQFLFNELGVSTLKLLLFVTLWYLQRRLRLCETALANAYTRAMALVRDHYDGLPPPQTYCGGGGDLSVPLHLFRSLDELMVRVKEHRQRRQRQRTLRELDIQLESLTRIYEIHLQCRDAAWFSWKTRSYDASLLFVFDLAGTVWILVVCPWFLLFIGVQVPLLFCSLWRTLDELRVVSKYVKFMQYTLSSHQAG